MEIKGYRAKATIDGDVCEVKALPGYLLRAYDHYKITKGGYLTGYWNPLKMGTRKKPYRDQLVQVPFRAFEVIHSDDVLLKLKIIR
jgi:hypothetical protein